MKVKVLQKRQECNKKKNRGTISVMLMLSSEKIKTYYLFIYLFKSTPWGSSYFHETAMQGLKFHNSCIQSKRFEYLIIDITNQIGNFIQFSIT